MLFWITIRSAIQSLMANKMRSLLAMLGIIIGVGAVIAMLAMGAGAQAQVVTRLQAMGTNLLVVQPQQRAQSGVKTGMYENLTVDDAVAIVNLPDVLAVTPTASGSAQLKFMNKNAHTPVLGAAVTYFEIRNFDIEKGRAFTDEETDRLARVALIGPMTAENLFGTDEPLNQTIKVGGINFKIIGVLKGKGNQGWFNPDDQIIIPYTTAMKILFGQKFLREIDILARPGVDLTTLSGQPPGAGGWGRHEPTVHTTPPPMNSVTELLRKRHNLRGLDPDDFRIQNQAEILETLSASIMTFRILLGSIAAISLLVGGIGIMNIMLVTVTERTREIGTRKAIGARSTDIMLQFLIEAVLMSALGGAIGALAGIGLAKGIPLIPIFKSFMTIVQPTVVIGAIVVSAVVGIVSGVYPAIRASGLDPIEALRYE